MTYMDQIGIFWHWHWSIYSRSSNFTKDNIIYKLTETEYESFWNAHIYE